MEIDIKYMERAIQLAKRGIPYAMPNPLVGCVIVDPQGRIIGEGYHRRCGEAHAEVNAIRSVRDKSQLKDSTMYVSLEPCAHHGRTGPCADLIIESGIPRVAIGTRDPFDQVDGRGIDRLRAAGVEVKVGVLEFACRAINSIFFTAHTLKRPYIALKWAQTRDGYLDLKRGDDNKPAQLSSVLTRTFVHRLRSIYDAVMVGSGTVISDNPQLTTRCWPGTSPRAIVLDRRKRIDSSYALYDRDPIIISDDKPLAEIMHDIYKMGITSVMVEGGPTLLQSLIDQGLWDFARVEIAPVQAGEHGIAPMPRLPQMEPSKIVDYEGQIIKYYSHNPLNEVKNL